MLNLQENAQKYKKLSSQEERKLLEIVKGTNKEEAEKRIDELYEIRNRAESEMIDLALQYDIELYIDGLGSLLLEEDNWTGKGRGEWYTSTDSCS